MHERGQKMNEKLIEERPAGEYKSTVEIPKYLLNSGMYRIRVRLSAGSSHYDIVDDIFFNVHDFSGSLQFMGLERKNALLYTRLRWLNTK